MGLVSFPIPMPILMCVVLIFVLLANVPVGFALLIIAASFALAIWGEGGLYILFQSLWNVMNNWVLISVPLFLFMAAVLDKSGIADEMFQAFYKLVGKYRGSLAIISILLGYVIGAMSGVTAAAISTLTLLVYPLMIKAGYDKRLAIGVVLGAGCLPQIVPPSLNAIVYGAYVGVSVAKLFLAGFVVGAIMAAFFIVYVLIYSHLYKDRVPVLVSEKPIPLAEKLKSLTYLTGPLAIILSVLGAIFTGIATPTEASGIGALASVVYALARRKLTKKALAESLMMTLKITSMCCWLLVGGYAFSSIFNAVGGKALFTGALLSLPAAGILVPLTGTLIAFVLGMFVDPGAITILIAPIWDAAIRALGLNPVWWGVIFVAVLITSYITPPVGLGLYYFKGIVGDSVSTSDVYKSVWPFAFLQLVAILVVLAWPDTIMWLIR